MNLLYIDNHLLAVNKPAGQLVQADSSGRTTLFDEAKEWIRTEYRKPGNVYLGLVHRLDRLTSGVVVFARTSKAAARLSEEIRKRRVRKTYLVRVPGELPKTGAWTDTLVPDDYGTKVADGPGGKEARLSFVRRAYAGGVSTAEVELYTGRKHQIRVQFAHRGFPVLGDRRYGSEHAFTDDAIALHAYRFEVKHPTRDERMSFTAEPEW